ncbi:MAG: hypothetical protein ACOY94_20535 [Bacillota bacterium]
MWWEGVAFWAAMAMIVYGSINAIIHVVVLIQSLRQTPRGVAYLVLVKDQADRVEGVVRTLAREETSDLLLVDLGSADESPAILERLALDYHHARFFRLGPSERSRAVAAALSVTQAPFVVLIDLSPDMAERGNA